MTFGIDCCALSFNHEPIYVASQKPRTNSHSNQSFIGELIQLSQQSKWTDPWPKGR